MIIIMYFEFRVHTVVVLWCYNYEVVVDISPPPAADTVLRILFARLNTNNMV